MKGIQYLILRSALFLFFLLVTSPFGFICRWLTGYCREHEQYRHYGWIVSVIWTAWFFGVAWFAIRAAEHMAFQNQKLGAATKSAFYDLRLRLAFLPMIGHWFEPNSQDDDDDDA